MEKAKQLAALLRDTAQSASNAIAGNISGPVDLLSMGMRGIGLPVPQNAFGGSQWMAEKGLTRDVPMGAPQIIGETLGMAGPALAANFAPQIARGLLQGADNLAAPRTLNNGFRGQRGAIDFPASWARPQRSDAIKSAADEFADKLNANGFQAQVEHSGSAMGPSSYVRIFDPQTGRFVVDPVRFSDHSKGATQSQMINEVRGSFDAPDVAKFYQLADEMRAKGPTDFMRMQQEKEAIAAAKKAQKAKAP